MIREYLFVYGTLRRGSASDMYRLLARNADYIGDACYQGRLYRIEDYPGVVASKHPAEQVKGEVYALWEPAKILSMLDDYEGCGPGYNEPTEYFRARQEVVLDDGRKLMAWVYIYQHPADGLEHIASGDYLPDKPVIPRH